MNVFPWILTFLSGAAAVIILEIRGLEALLAPFRGLIEFFIPNG